MRTFKFVHAADLHLGSPFKGIYSLEPRIGDYLLNAGYTVFNNILRLCIQHKVDFLLVAGDIFDAEDRGLKAQIRFRDGLAELARNGIKSYIVHGNHDPLSGWAAQLDWHDNVKIFGDRIETVSCSRDGEILCHIQGMSYPEAKVYENLAQKFNRPKDSPFAIALLHANVGSQTGHEPYAPCSLQDLISAGFDYWALGHVHKTNVLQKENPAVVYPGNPQGLHINETGKRGVYLVSVQDGKVSDLSFIPIDVIRWYNLTGSAGLDVSSAETEEELLKLIEDQYEKVKTDAEDRSVILRLELQGRTSLHSQLFRDKFLLDLESTLMERWIHTEPFLFLESLINKTRLKVDIDQRRKAGDFIAEVLDLIDENRKNPEMLQALQKDALSTLYESRIWPRELQVPSESELRDILNDAESLLVDNLLGEESS